MAEFPALPLWTDAWVADTNHLSRLQRGTYHDLLILMWRTPGCRVPNDNAWLAVRLRMTEHEVACELRPLIAEFCQCDGNWIKQKRLTREIQYVRRASERQSVRAKGRWEKKKADAAGMRTRNAPTPTPTPTPPSISNTNVLDMPKRKTRISLPDNFPEDSDRQWSMAYWLRFGRTDLCNGMGEEIEKFRDHHQGQLTASANWPGSWRTWTRNAIKFNHGGHNGRPERKSNHQTFFDAAGAVAARILAEDAQARAPGPATIVLLPTRPIDPAD